MAYSLKPDFIFRRNGRIHLNRRGRQFSRLLAAEVCAPAVVMLDTPCSEVVWRVLAIHSIRQFPFHFPSRASPCAITFQLDSTCIFCFFTKESTFTVRRPLANRRISRRLPDKLLTTPQRHTICVRRSVVTRTSCSFVMLHTVLDLEI